MHVAAFRSTTCTGDRAGGGGVAKLRLSVRPPADAGQQPCPRSVSLPCVSPLATSDARRGLNVRPCCVVSADTIWRVLSPAMTQSCDRTGGRGGGSQLVHTLLHAATFKTHGAVRPTHGSGHAMPCHAMPCRGCWRRAHCPAAECPAHQQLPLDTHTHTEREADTRDRCGAKRLGLYWDDVSIHSDNSSSNSNSNRLTARAQQQRQHQRQQRRCRPHGQRQSTRPRRCMHRRTPGWQWAWQQASPWQRACHRPCRSSRQQRGWARVQASPWEQRACRRPCRSNRRQQAWRKAWQPASPCRSSHQQREWRKAWQPASPCRSSRHRRQWLQQQREQQSRQQQPWWSWQHNRGGSNRGGGGAVVGPVEDGLGRGDGDKSREDDSGVHVVCVCVCGSVSMR
ncbi:hypothetical protein BC831DRAFT_240465 [Entophlyctis helioformis]|nr:hypothetical protein BC831DRAFT_240465 [Entophlyctis helioformis]